MHWCKAVLFLFIISVPSISKSNDSIRIVSYPKHLHVHVRINTAESSIDIRNPDIKESLKLGLNSSSHLKIGFFYSWLGLSASISLPRDKEENRKFGKSKGYALEAHIMKTRLMIDLAYKNYHGYYFSNPDEFIPDWNSDNVYPQIPDLGTKVVSINAGYVFRPDKFSPTAAYMFTKSMRKTGGSWILGGFGSMSYIKSDSSIVSRQILQWVDHKLNLKEVRFTDVGVSFGYAFLLTILKKNFVSLSFLPGIAYQHSNQQLAEDFSRKKTDALSLRSTIHFSMGRNGNKFYYGVNAFMESGLTKSQNTEIGLNSGYGEIFLGYRINTSNWGFMRKVDKIMNPDFFDLFIKKE